MECFVRYNKHSEKGKQVRIELTSLRIARHSELPVVLLLPYIRHELRLPLTLEAVLIDQRYTLRRALQRNCRPNSREPSPLVIIFFSLTCRAHLLFLPQRVVYGQWQESNLRSFQSYGNRTRLSPAGEENTQRLNTTQKCAFASVWRVYVH